MTAHAWNQRSDVDVESDARLGRALLDGIETIDRSERPTAGGRDEDAAPRRTRGGDGSSTADEATVRENLAPVLVALVADPDRRTHGKALLGQIADLFGVHLRPGTIYPVLDELEAESVIGRHEEVVRVNEYRLDDEAAARELVAGSASRDHAVGEFCRQATRRMSSGAGSARAPVTHD
jgi:hypothetical protein